MKKKLLLFSMALLSAGIILAPNVAMADVTSSSQDYTVTIPTAAAWHLVQSGNSFSPTSQHFDFTGHTHTADLAAVTFGAAATPDSYLITNDVSTVDNYVVTVDPTGTAGTTAEFTGNTVLNVYNASANVNINVTAVGVGTQATIGSVAFARSGTNLVTDGSAMTPDGAMFPVDMQLDLDQSTLTEADAPTSLTFGMTFTVATVTP